MYLLSYIINNSNTMIINNIYPGILKVSIYEDDTDD